MSESRIGNYWIWKAYADGPKLEKTGVSPVVFLNVKSQAGFFPGCPSFSKWSSIFKSAPCKFISRVTKATSRFKGLMLIDRKLLPSSHSCHKLRGFHEAATQKRAGHPGKSLKLHGFLLHNVDLGKFRFSLHFKCRWSKWHLVLKSIFDVQWLPWCEWVVTSHLIFLNLSNLIMFCRHALPQLSKLSLQIKPRQASAAKDV